jgi:cholesterol transport system auxiliary component
MIRRILTLAGLAACAVALSACISLLPKSKPSQLYRFGQGPIAVSTASASAAAASKSVAVFHSHGDFQEESSDDRLLTLTGGKAAYIANSRWVAPAEILFNEAVANAFDASKLRLIDRGQQGRYGYALRIDVPAFEARYDAGPKGAPTVVVHVHAALTKADQSSVGEQDFEARIPASDNRVGAIVTAYDKAVREVIGKLVVWTEAAAV